MRIRHSRIFSSNVRIRHAKTFNIISKVRLYGAVCHKTLTANTVLKAEASGFGLENCIVKTHIGRRFQISLD